RLAGPGGAEQREELAAADVEIEMLHDHVDTVVGLLHAAKAHQRLTGSRFLASARARGGGERGRWVQHQRIASKLSERTRKPSSSSASDAVNGTRIRITFP